MELGHLPLGIAISAFLLAFPALFSIVNPIGSALIFHQVTGHRTRQERCDLARTVAIYAAIVLLVSLWLGGYVLAFFGISLSALRIAGGLVVAVRAWSMLMEPEVHHEQKSASAEPAQAADDIAFFPLTMPLTTGPGTIAVAIALASQRPANGVGTLAFFAGVSLAALIIAFSIWLCYRWSGTVTELLGPSGARIVSRLVAFLLLCVGVQIIVTGVIAIGEVIAARH
jgi:multiple antibiotic resistance protein